MLSAADLLAIWDGCVPQPPAVRVLTLLAAAGPVADPASLPLGRRDAALLELHVRAFGGRLDAVADCPACGERLEFAVDPEVLVAPEGGAAELAMDRTASSALPAAGEPGPLTVRAGRYEVRCRLPAAGDLAALPADGAELLARCVLGATRDGVPVDAGGLPAAVRAAVEERMAAADPGAEILLALTCTACETGWVEPLDPAAFVWAELDDRAQRLAAEVHRLAAAYGWAEAEILALSPWRRRLYLDAVAG
jgi:hypothetical protein